MSCREGGRRCGSVLLGCCLVSALTASAPAHSEGGDKRTGGDWGANRRVRTFPGYVGVAGTFTVNTAISIPTDEHGVVSLTSNPFNCGYSFYLGGGTSNGRLEVDAGLQWCDLDSQEAENRKLPQSNQNPIHPEWVGWAAFINCSRIGQPSAYTCPRYLTADDGFQPWRCNFKQPTYGLKYIVTRAGYLALTIDGPGWPGGTVYWRERAYKKNQSPLPLATDQVWPSLSTLAPTDRVVVGDDEFQELYVKRSTAITHATGAEGQCDGTSFDCTFSDGTVYAANQGTADSPTAWSWEKRQCDQSLTGYDVEEFNSHAIDRTFFGMATTDSRFKMAFPVLGNPARHAGSEDLEEDQGRYSDEQVQISLINGAWPKVVRDVEPSPR